MSNVDQTRAFLFSGKLIATPTDLTIASPYGGTVMGAMRQVRLIMPRPMHQVQREEKRDTAEKIRGGMRVWLRGFVRQWDRSAILAMLPDAALDADGKPLISCPGASLRAGALGTAVATKIIFAADDPVNNPSILIYSAIPEILADGIDFSAIAEGTIFAEWEGIEDSLGRLFQVGYIARMSL